MGDFRIDRRGGFRPPGPGFRQEGAQAPAPRERGPGRPAGFEDSLSPEMTARARFRHQGPPRPPQEQEEGQQPGGPPRPRRLGEGFGRPGRPAPDGAHGFPGREGRAARDPQAEAAAFIARVDQDGDGSVTEAELALHFQGPARPVAQAPATELVDEAPVEDAEPLPDDTAGEEAAWTPEAIVADLLAQIASIKASPEYEAWPEEDRQLLDAQEAAIQALDPGAEDFEAQLTALLEA